VRPATDRTLHRERASHRGHARTSRGDRARPSTCFLDSKELGLEQGLDNRGAVDDRGPPQQRYCIRRESRLIKCWSSFATSRLAVHDAHGRRRPV
jgi:hypothetical protein